MFNVWGICKYWFFKIVLTGLVYGFAGQQNYMGWAVITGGTILFTTLSVLVIGVLYIFLRNGIRRIKINSFRKTAIIFGLLAINEFAYFALFPENALPGNRNITESIFQICDGISTFVCGYVFFILPMQKAKA